MFTEKQIADFVSKAHKSGASNVDETTLATLSTKRQFRPGLALGTTLVFPKKPEFAYFTETIGSSKPKSVQVLKITAEVNGDLSWLPVSKLQASQDLVEDLEVSKFLTEEGLTLALKVHNATTVAEISKAIAGKTLVYDKSFSGTRTRFDGVTVPCAIAFATEQ